MAKIIGRKEEIDILQSIQQTDKSAFVALYGRRRVGKTYLIRSVFDGKFTFQLRFLLSILPQIYQEQLDFRRQLLDQWH